MKPISLFFVLTFGLFLVGFAIAGGMIALGAPEIVVAVVQIAMAWTPTISVAIIHRRIEPSRRFFRLVADRFTARIGVIPLSLSLLGPLLVAALAGIGCSLILRAPLSELLGSFSFATILLLFADSIIRGPLGEELGWRGYALRELQKRYSPLASSTLLGAIWGIWHLPLWFVSGFSGTDLLAYIAAFYVGLVSFSVIIGAFYRSGSGNLIYAIILHQMLNFTIRLFETRPIAILGATSAIYLIAAALLAVTVYRIPANKKPETTVVHP